MATVDFTTCQPNQEWVDRLTQSRDLLVEAGNIWTFFANRAVGAIRTREYKYAQEGSRPTIIECLDVPAYFSLLTDLLIAWCDVSVPNIDAEPLSICRDMILNYDGTIPVSDPELILSTFQRCLRLLTRIRVASFLVPTTRTGTDDEGNGATDDDAVEGVEKPGVHGLTVNLGARTIRRKGYEGTVSLDARPVVWHVFRVLFLAGDRQATLDKLRNGYPGEWNGNARNQAYNELKIAIAPLGMTVQNRQLVPLRA